MNVNRLAHLEQLQSKLSIRQLQLEILQGYDREQLLTNKIGLTVNDILPSAREHRVLCYPFCWGQYYGILNSQICGRVYQYQYYFLPSV